MSRPAWQFGISRASRVVVTMHSLALLAAVLLPPRIPSVEAGSGETGDAATGTTSLTRTGVDYAAVDGHEVTLRRGPVEIVVVDNEAAQSERLPEHRPGYSGVAAISHDAQPRGSEARGRNLFVPFYAGLNFEHVHDGTNQGRDILFEPRVSPNSLRRVDDFTVELYQPPTATWGVESCQRYELLPDGTIELTIELIPRKASFHHGYMGLFWASYIHQPESKDVFFRGIGEPTQSAPEWIRGVTPAHGTRSTHVGVTDVREFKHDEDFPLTLVFNNSPHRYSEPWYYGVSHGMAYAQMFRPGDDVRLTQSPSGGGDGNPAWDFQYLIDDVKVGRLYRFVMRAMYLPYESIEQVEFATAVHRRALGHEN